jgi:SRSO17 transposase
MPAPKGTRSWTAGFTCFEENKSELGLDHYEHRSWTAWHRHMRLVFLAQLFLLRLQTKFKKSNRSRLKRIILEELLSAIE